MIPKLWPDRTCYIIGGGPSLRLFDIDRLKGQRCIAVNEAYTIAPWVDVLFFNDEPWWKRHRTKLLDFGGLKVTTCEALRDKPGIKVVERKNSPPGIAHHHPTWIRWNMSSGGAAINLAYHFGVSRIILLGFDMRRVWLCQKCGHEHDMGTMHSVLAAPCPKCGAESDRRHNWHMNHEVRKVGFNPYIEFLKPFPRIASDLRHLGVECINATPGSALQVFPICHPDEVLPGGALC